MTSALRAWGALVALVALLAPRAGARQDSGARRPPAPNVDSIVVEGEQRYTEAQLAAVLGQTLGRPLDVEALNRGLQRLWSSFHVRGDTTLREVPGGVELHLIVEELPVDRDPRFVGNDAIDEKTLLKWALLEEKSELYLHQAGRVRQRLLEGYRKEGFYFAEVNVLERQGDGDQALPDVIFEIREGHKVRVADFVVTGNRSMPDGRFLYFFKEGLWSLADRDLVGPHLFNWLGSPFVEETLQADLLSMRSVYRDRGWLDAVVELERLEFDADRSHVTIHVAIDEGQRYTVGRLAIVGVEWDDPDDDRNTGTHEVPLLFPEAELLAKCGLTSGVIFERVQQQRDLVALREYYGTRGYISHPSLPRRLNWTFAEPELLFDVERHTVDVTYRIAQGRELFFREVLLNGTHHTRDRVVRRELSVFEGQRADLREVERSIARVQGTRYFSDDMNRGQHRDPYYRLLPVADEPGKVDLEVVVDEGRVIDFNISGGIDTDNGAFAVLSLTMRNFDATDLPRSFGGAIGEIADKTALHGAGQQLDIVLSPGTRVSDFRVHFIEPDIWGSHLRPTSFEIDLRRNLRTYSSHDVDRFERRVRFGRRFDYDVFAWIGYVNALVDVSNLDGDGVPLSLAYQDSQGETTLAGLTLDASTRSLDNYLVPHSGYSLRLNNTFYSQDLGGDYDILQSDLMSDVYVATGEKEDGTKPVLHLELDLGAAQPYGDTFAVPYTERYFLGGTKSLRGFSLRGVGPMDPLSGYPEGGETTLSGTAEWFYPLHSTPQAGTYKMTEVLRGSVFLDFGCTSIDPWQLDMGELRASVGVGFGLAYPLPLTLNFGFPIRSFSGDDRQTFSFSLGSP